MKKVSVIIPCYNEEKNIEKIYAALQPLMDGNTQYEWEILMINDGSQDNTLELIKQLRTTDQRICYIDLSRNFGKENAMLAGFDYVTGDCTAIMDADLQHPPMVINDMLKLWEEGYQDIYAKRISRGKESLMRKYFTKTYYWLLNKMANTEVLPNVGDFRLLDRKCINALKQLRETQRYTKGLYCWIGFKKHFVHFNQEDRKGGKSSFSIPKLLNLAIEGITSYTTAPLRISTYLGIFVSLTMFLYICFIIIKTIFIGEPVRGYPTLIITILFLGGVQLITIGIIGEYLSRIFYETKHRPAYIINEIETSCHS